MWDNVTLDQMQYLWIGMAQKYGKYVDADLENQMKLFQQIGRSFLYKFSSHTKHNWHCTIGLLINAATLNVYFTLFFGEAITME